MNKNNRIIKFNESGNLKVLQVTDIHGIYKNIPDTVRHLEKVLDDKKPDLVIFTGDQIKGYGLSFLTGDRNVKFRKALNFYLEPVNKRGIPFLFTFGNHDPQVKISFDDQLSVYKEYSCCVLGDDEYRYDASTYSVPVFSSNGIDPVFNIYMIYSGTSAEGGGYEAVTPERIEWYRTIREKLRDKYGRYIPSVVFQHIPVREIYNLYDEVSKKHPDAIEAYRTHKGKFYKLKDEFTDGRIHLYEPSAVPDINTGEFEAIKEKGEVFGMFFGHDHQNNFIGTYDGVDLGYSPACGFNEYGNGVSRGFRIYEFNEKDVRNYKTHIVTYRDYFGTKVIKPIKNNFLKIIPTSFDAAKPLIFKLVGGLLCVILLIVLLCNLL